MPFSVTNGIGDSVEEPSLEQLRSFLDELDSSDLEHGAAWIEDDLGNILEWNVDGRLVYDSDDRGTRHLQSVSRQRALELWQLVIAESFHELEREPWKPGAHPPLSPQEAERRAIERADFQLKADHEFFVSLGPERSGGPCREPHCLRGSIHQSVFCRIHHFEQIKKRPCPFRE